jgi:hypothetical protein
MQIQNKMYLLLFVALLGLQQGVLGMQDQENSQEEEITLDKIKKKLNEDEANFLDGHIKDYETTVKTETIAKINLDKIQAENAALQVPSSIITKHGLNLAGTGLLLGLPGQVAYGVNYGAYKALKKIDGKIKLSTRATDLLKKLPYAVDAGDLFMNLFNYDTLTGQTKVMRNENGENLNKNLKSYRTKGVNGGITLFKVGMATFFAYLLLKVARKNARINGFINTYDPNIGGIVAHYIAKGGKIGADYVAKFYKEFANYALINPSKTDYLK